jgi:O-antigen/teichoic acid export membrane protein
VVEFKKLLSVITLKPFDTSTENGRSKERYRKIVLSAGSSAFYRIVTVATGLISIPLTVEYLGVERFSLWMVITSILALITFVDLGLGNGLVNAIAKSDGEDDTGYVKKAISSTFFLLLTLSIILCGLFFIIYPFIDWGNVFNIKSQIAIDEAGPALAIFLVSFFLNLPLSIVQKIQLGYQHGYKNNLWLGLGSILSLIGILIAIYFKMGLPYLVGLMVAGPLISVILNGLFLFKGRFYLIPRFKNFDITTSKKLLGVGIVFFFLQLFTVIGGSVDNIIIAQVLGASAVASYAITKKMFLAIQISQFIIAPLWPAFSESIARKDYYWAKSTLKKILKISMLMGALTALPLVLFGQDIIKLWVNEDVVPTTTLLIGFFLFSIFQNYGGSMSVFLNNNILIKKQLKFVAVSAVSSVIFQILFSMQFGVEGIIYGLLLGYSIFYVLPAYRLAFGFLERKITKHYND